jgi:transcriptional regulator with XRE-family HTH domain
MRGWNSLSRRRQLRHRVHMILTELKDRNILVTGGANGIGRLLEEVAARLRMDKGQLSRLETGRQQNFTFVTVERIAEGEIFRLDNPAKVRSTQRQ